MPGIMSTTPYEQSKEQAAYDNQTTQYNAMVASTITAPSSYFGDSTNPLYNVNPRMSKTSTPIDDKYTFSSTDKRFTAKSRNDERAPLSLVAQRAIARERELLDLNLLQLQ